jgi:hypothetical protein
MSELELGNLFGKMSHALAFSDEQLRGLIPALKLTIGYLEGRGQSLDTVYRLRNELRDFERMVLERNIKS